MIGDAAAAQSGMDGGAVDTLSGNRLSAIDLANKAQAVRQQREDEFADWKRRRQWELGNSAPGGPSFDDIQREYARRLQMRSY